MRVPVQYLKSFVPSSAQVTTGHWLYSAVKMAFILHRRHNMLQ